MLNDIRKHTTHKIAVIGLLLFWFSEIQMYLPYLDHSFNYGDRVHELCINKDDCGLGSIQNNGLFKFFFAWKLLQWQGTDGIDADMNPMTLPLFDTQNSRRLQLDIGL